MRESAISTPSSTGSAPPERPGAGAARDEGHTGAVAGPHDRLHLARSSRQHDGARRDRVLEQPVRLVRAQLVLVRDDVLGADRGAQLFDERRQDGAGRHFTTIQSSTAVDCR